MTPRFNRHGRAAGLGLLGLLACSIAVLWSWNSFAADLLGLPEMGWRHALALCLMVLCLGLLVALPARWLGRAREG